jgi:hypothetical protein
MCLLYRNSTTGIPNEEKTKQLFNLSNGGIPHLGIVSANVKNIFLASGTPEPVNSSGLLRQYNLLHRIPIHQRVLFPHCLSTEARK